MQEQTDLVELWTIQYTTRKFFVHAGRRAPKVQAYELCISPSLSGSILSRLAEAETRSFYILSSTFSSREAPSGALQHTTTPGLRPDLDY